MMTLRTIAVKNIARRKGKMGLIVFGLALATATLVAVVSLNQAFQGKVDDQLNDYGFNIVIFPKTKQLAIEYGGLTVGSINSYRAPALGRKEVDKVASIARAGRVRGFSPKLLDVAEVNGKRVLVAGIDLAVERRIKKWWVIEAGRYPSAAGELFVGQTAAEKLGLELGNRVELFGRTFTVAGILMETGAQDDQLVFTDLAALRELTGKPGQVSLIEVAAKTAEDVEPLAKRLAAALPSAGVQSVKQAVKLKENALGHLFRFGLGITGVVVLISAMIVFTMMASAVNERRTEIGIFRAVGFRRRKVATVVLTEAVILGAAGGLAGYLFGFLLAQLLPLAGGGQAGAAPMVVRPSLMLAVSSVLLSLTVGLAASLIPAWRAANLDPIESLKSL